MPSFTFTQFKKLSQKQYFSFLFLFLFTALSAFGQGSLCNEAEEFCPSSNGDDVTFPAGVNNGDAEAGNNYGCLGSTPNPAWYYIQIGQPGSITITLTNSNNEDIDFALWGPFEDLNVANATCGFLPNPTDCSFSFFSTEIVEIPNSQPGQIYLLLITNFSNDQTDIFGEASGNGVPACCTTPINTGLTCPESATFSCGCWTNGFVGVLPTSNPAPAPPSFCGTTENQVWVDVESCWCAVTVEVAADNCPNAQGIEAQLFSECAPFTPISDCITVANGTSEFLTGLSGTSQIDCEIGGTYTLLLDGIDGDVCSYTVTATEIPITPPVFSQDTIIGPSMVCFGDTVSYQFPDIDFATFCDATFTATDAEVINVTHEGFQVVFGETSGTLCIQASNCAGTTQICLFITVEECCFSEPGSLFANDFILCEGQIAQVAHTGDELVAEGDTSLYVLHNGIGFPIGNIIEENASGLFSFQVPMQLEQTYFIDFVTGRIGTDGEINYDHTCLDFAENRNTLTYLASSPPLEIGDITKVCDDLAAFYTIEFEILNGIQPYTVNGEILDDNFYVSPPIPAGEVYSFDITSVNFCLDPLTVNGQEECPCETFAGMIEDEFAELCGDDVVQIIPTEAPILDNNDVLVYVLRNTSGETILENTTGNFFFQTGVNYNEQYSICAYAGNNDGTGSPITNYACFSSSNCKDVVFYEDINIVLPDSVNITCDRPTASINSLITGGSNSYTTVWTKDDGTVISEEEDIIVSEAGVYTLTVLDTQTDCESSESIVAIVAPIITGIDIQIIDPTCFEDNDGSILIGAVEGGVEPFTYKLDDGFFTGNTELIALSASDYELTVKDENGCEFKIEAIVNQPIEVLVDLGEDIEIQLGEETTVSAETTIDEGRVTWTINEIVQVDTLFEIDSVFLESVLVQAMVTDTNGCFAEDMLRINVEQKDPVFIPNAFSPNGDGHNERLSVFGDISVVSVNYMRVYDRWGSLLYDAPAAFLPNDTSVGWDGTFGGDAGQAVNSDVYIYTLEVTYIDGRSEVFTGDVVLVR